MYILATYLSNIAMRHRGQEGAQGSLEKGEGS